MSQNGSSDSSSYVDENWAAWFCNLSGNQYFCEVEKSYMEDSFNLFGLKQHLPKDYSKALDSILDRLNPNEPETEDLSRSAVLLYGLIHARYIITSHGLEAMHRKYINKDFGECPRMLCRGQPVVPMGFTDDPKHGMVKLFCPKCRDVYNCHINQRHVDGAFFGPTFPNLFFMTYEGLVPGQAMEQFVPRVFGFRIHPCSNSLPKAPSPTNLNVALSSSSSASRNNNNAYAHASNGNGNGSRNVSSLVVSSAPNTGAIVVGGGGGAIGEAVGPDSSSSNLIPTKTGSNSGNNNNDNLLIKGVVIGAAAASATAAAAAAAASSSNGIGSSSSNRGMNNTSTTTGVSTGSSKGHISSIGSNCNSGESHTNSVSEETSINNCNNAKCSGSKSTVVTESAAITGPASTTNSTAASVSGPSRGPKRSKDDVSSAAVAASAEPRKRGRASLAS